MISYRDIAPQIFFLH